jgi:hypothetical protein
MAKFVENGAVELYHNNVKTFHTKQNGVVVEGTEGASAILELRGDQGDDNNDYFRIVGGGGYFYAQNYASGSWETHVAYVGNGAVELYYDNSKKFETISTGVDVQGFDIRFSTSGGWSGEACKIQHHNNRLYIQGGSDGHRFRRSDGNDAWGIDASGHLFPAANNTYDIGTTSNRVRNIYTNDLNLSNEGGANDVDGTWGSYTIQEGAEDLFLMNKRNGKKYKFNLMEVN